VCQNVSARGGPGGSGPLDVNLGPPIASETTGARKLQLKTQLDVVKYKNVSAMWRPGDAGLPSVNLGPLIYRKLLELESFNLKIPLDVVKYPLWVQKLLYYTIQQEGSRHIDFRQMSVSPGQTTANKCKTAFTYM